MITRQNQLLKSLLLNTISHGALDYAIAPKMFAVGIALGYGQGLTLAPSLNAPLSFLTWVQMWLCLVLGLEAGEEPSHASVGTYAVPAIFYRQVETENSSKPPAHNLEALMRFAPDALGQGLTLNQYRERFTRLSVMGRVQIYRALAKRAVIWRRRILSGLNNAMPVLSHAPLRPD